MGAVLSQIVLPKAHARMVAPLMMKTRKGKLNVPHPHTCSRARFAQLARLGGAKRCFANSRLNPQGGATHQLATFNITMSAISAFLR